jgi:ribonucleoside-diphosphate reductase alpha chain
MEVQGGSLSYSVRKRDGITLQPYKPDKVRVAIQNAWRETGAPMSYEAIEDIAQQIEARALLIANDGVIDVEKIQDLVEVTLMKHGHFDVAKAYILYRSKRSEVRQARLQPDPEAVANYIHPGKYARYIPELRRREVFEETVARVESMHLRKFAHVPEVEGDIRWAFDRVREKRALPSMRSMQFGGTAIESNNNRMYNCTFSFVDRPRVFAEALYLLLCGSGVGFSVQFEHVEKLPALKNIDMKKVRHHTVADSIEGWADALDRLIDSYVRGYYVEFNYSRIRPEGAPLITSGGKAPGHLQLKSSLEAIRGILDEASGRRLRPIECYDIMCHAADAVLSGGIRRSAMICLFSLEDSEMMNAKTGSWYPRHPWRANSNNSVMLKRDEVKKKNFKRIFEMTRQWGEPGFYFCNDYDHGTNPCVEIGLNPVLTIDDDVMQLLEERVKRGKEMPRVKKGERVTGWAFCNLTEQNAAKFKTFEDFKIAARACAIIGTLQAAYTDMPYLGWVSECIAEREALLGVGMTGIMDSPQIALNREHQREVAQLVIDTNREIAAKIGVRPAARTTCVKPSGTTSLELGCVGSGHHPHHARRYIRRVVANELEPTFIYFRSINPHMCVRKPDGDWVIEFPVQAPDGAVVKADLGALEFLDSVRQTQVNWVLPGTARPDSTAGLTHNVSNTCVVRESEWDTVAEYLWESRAYFTGVSLLPATGDKDYAFAPCEAVVTEADEAKWNYLVANYKPVDYTKITEDDDGTDLTGEAACAGGACSI